MIIRKFSPPFLLLFTSILLPSAADSAASNSQTKSNAQPKLFATTLYHTPSSASLAPASQAKELAILEYNLYDPALSKLKSFTPPSNTTIPIAGPEEAWNTDDAWTQILTYLPLPSTSNTKDDKTTAYRTTAAYRHTFHAPYEGRFRIVVDPTDGTLVSAGWRAWLSATSASREGGKSTSEKKSDQQTNAKEKRKGKQANPRGDFDVVLQAEAPSVIFERKARGGAGTRGADADAEGGSVGSQGLEGEDGEEASERTFLQKYWWLLLAVAVLAVTSSGGE